MTKKNLQELNLTQQQLLALDLEHSQSSNTELQNKFLLYAFKTCYLMLTVNSDAQDHTHFTWTILLTLLILCILSIYIS